jgi:hypothetical protein
MANAGEAKADHALDGTGQRALRGVIRAGEELLVHVLLARLAQRLERGRVAVALGQAVPAVAERVRTCAEATGGERVVVGERERLAQVTADVLADREPLELVLGDGCRMPPACSVLLVAYFAR